jgi:hypothetical protein
MRKRQRDNEAATGLVLGSSPEVPTPKLVVDGGMRAAQPSNARLLVTVLHP